MLSSNYIWGKNKCCVFTGIELVSYLEVDLTYGRNGKANRKGVKCFIYGIIGKIEEIQ